MRRQTSYIIYAFLAACFLSFNAVAKPLKFELQENTLGTVTEKNWQGKFLLMGIGYTSCPDICPTTVIDLATAVNSLKDEYR